MTVTGVPSQTIISTEKIQDCSIGWQSSAANLSFVYSEFMHTGKVINFEWYCETLGKLKAGQRIYPHMELPLLQHKNAQTHTTLRTTAMIRCLGFSIFDHPTYS
jgi:hypothetical protein